MLILSKLLGRRLNNFAWISVVCVKNREKALCSIPGGL